jgi:hypothetical protein
VDAGRTARVYLIFYIRFGPRVRSTIAAAPRGEDGGRKRGGSDKVRDDSRWIMLSSETLATPTPQRLGAHILWQITIFHVATQSPCFKSSGLLPLHRNESLETIPYNLAVATMVAAYSQSLPPIDVGTLQTPPGDPALCECRPPPFKEAKGRL